MNDFFVNFNVYSVSEELLGHFATKNRGCGDSLWAKARELAAGKIGIQESDITIEGVKTKNGFMNMPSASNVPVPEVRFIACLHAKHTYKSYLYNSSLL